MENCDDDSPSSPPGWSLPNRSAGSSTSNPSSGGSSSIPSQGESSSSSSNLFPVGLRVLVVDDDRTCLNVVEQMLTKCKYQVTTCEHPLAALSIIRERKGGFDVVITDIHMPEMDGFKLLEIIGLETDLPVIMMSVDCQLEVALKGLEYGACYYLMKPVCMEEVKNVWQHVLLRRRKLDGKENEQVGSAEGNSPMNPSTEDIEYAKSANEGDSKKSKRRRDSKEKGEDNDEDDIVDNSGQKKNRVIWNSDLHSHFLKAVDKLGYDKAVPKKILEIMRVPGITRENIASHLQKYRIFLRRLNDANRPPPQSLKPNFGTVPPHLNYKFRNQTGAPQFTRKTPNPVGPQPGSVGRLQNLNGPMTTQATNPMQFLNQGQSSNPMGRLNLGPSPMMNGPENWHQAPPGFSPTKQPYLMQQNVGGSGLGMSPMQPNMGNSGLGMGPMQPNEGNSGLGMGPMQANSGNSGLGMGPMQLNAGNSGIGMGPMQANVGNSGIGMGLMQSNIGNSDLGMGPNLTRMGTSSAGDISVGPMRSYGTMQMVHQQQEGRSGLFGGSPLGNFGDLSVQCLYDNPSTVNAGLFSGPSQIPPSNYTGLRMTSTGGLYGMTQTGPIFEASNNNSSHSDRLSEIKKGKRPMVMEGGDPPIFEFSSLNFGYNNHGAGSSNGMGDANQHASRFADVIQGENGLLNGIYSRNGDPGNVMNSEAFGNSSLPQNFGDDELDDLIFNQLDDTDFFIPDLDLSSFPLDDDNLPE